MQPREVVAVGGLARRAARELRANGAVVHEAPTLRAATTLLDEGCGCCPDLLLVDATLPDGTAGELVAHVRAAFRTCTTDIAVIAASDGEAAALEGAVGGASAVVVAPFTLESFAQAAAAFSLRWRRHLAGA